MKKLLLAAVLVCLSAPAFAQAQCNTYENVNKLLGAEKYQEVVVAAGVSTSGRLVEIYLNEETGGFSIVSTSADKTSCLVLAGDGFTIKSEKQRKLEAIKRLPTY